MNHFKVLLTEPIRPAGTAVLKNEAEYVVASDPRKDTIAAIIADFDALITRNTFIGEEVLSKAKRLKVIASHGVGTDHIDVEAATRHGIAVVNTPSANSESVAEATVALMLAISRKIVFSDSALRIKRDFYLRSQCVGQDLRGKTVGIVGVGQIGRRVARICRWGFDMTVLGLDPFINSEQMRQYDANPADSLEELLKASDYVSLNCPYCDQYHHMIDAEKLALMKRTAFLINCARGQLVDEDALYDALKHNIIAGAAIDVYDKEPPCADTPLFSLENIIVTPHIAAFSQESIDNMSSISAVDVLKVLKGEAAQANVVNKTVICRQKAR